MSLKDQLAFVQVQHAVFHFVPVRRKGDSSTQPTLMSEETPLDDDSKQLLEDRLRGALKSTQSFEVQFDNNRTPVVKDLVLAYLLANERSGFVSCSAELATYLFTIQKGNNSPGLFALLECALGERRALAIVKIEKQTGSQLQPGTRYYKMEVLRNLFFTEGTRVFKSALFVLENNQEVSILACDDQRSLSSEHELARFFLETYLGCKNIEAPRSVTKRFYYAAIRFIDEAVPEPPRKNALFDDVRSQLRRRSGTVSLREFAREYIPGPLQDRFVSFMQNESVPISFTKDNELISRQLYAKVLKTRSGIQVRVPNDDADALVTVENRRIIVADILAHVAGQAR